MHETAVCATITEKWENSSLAEGQDEGRGMMQNRKGRRIQIWTLGILMSAVMLAACGQNAPDLYEDTKLVAVSEVQTGAGTKEQQEGAAPGTQNVLPTEPGTGISLEPAADSAFTDHLSEKESLFINRAGLFYYYTQLAEEEQQLYDALHAVAMDPTSTEYHKTVHVTEDPSSNAFMQELTIAYEALIYDHPELFWFRQNGGNFKFYYAGAEPEDGYYTVAVGLSAVYERYEEEMTAFNAAADSFLAGIDMTQSKPYIALEIHDRLIELVSYDDELAAIYASDQSYDYGYSAYGALVENSRGQANKAVCDGYSYAYQYLLQQAGIDAVRVGGYAGNETDGLLPHSWNLVCLDGEWYETDPTWDDRDPEIDTEQYGADILMQAAADEEFWDRIRHYMYGRTTAEIENFVPDWTYTYYTAGGYVSFLGPSVHIRGTVQGEEGMVDLLSALAPVAEGTKYSYEHLTGNGRP